MTSPTPSDVVVVGAAAVALADVDTFCVAMATDEHGEQFGLSFQVPIDGEYDDQDRRLGMDTYSISDHLGRTAYGGIVAWSAQDVASALTVEFSPAVASTLEIPLILRFHLPPDKFHEITAGFRRILAGHREPDHGQESP
jgi:hypothetical protein